MIEGEIAGHYAQTDLERTILQALSASGVAIERLTPEDLAPVDEFHSGGREATVALAEKMALRSEMHLLDVGCGIGGPSRFFAARYGCRVTGIDLTHDYVATAEALARRLDLAGLITYRQANATALPFDDQSFDGAYMMHVGMNIENKPGAFAEIRRVLKAGAPFAVYDVMKTGEQELSFPVHWASDARMSFVESPDVYRHALETAGFAIVDVYDRGDFARAFFAKMAALAAERGGDAPLVGTHLLMKKDVPQKTANVRSMLEKRLIAPFEMICRAR